MILRKPFAVLIKYFKLIHLVLAGFSIYLAIRTSHLLSFFSEYITDLSNVSGTDLTGTLFSGLMFVAIFIMIIGSIVIAGLMAFKEKPITFYVINILIYIYVVVVFFITRSILSALEIGLVDIRTLKMVQDLLTTSMLLQVVNLILLSIRATGFDIKKFNFVKDLEELEITDVDNEEFEVELGVDTDKIQRQVRRFFRHTKYIYKENRLVIHLFLALLIGGSCYYVYSEFVQKNTYNENVAFSTSEYVMTVENSYVTNVDYTGNKISDDKTLIVVQMNIQSYYSKGSVLETGKLLLSLKEHYFSPTINYREQMIDLGNNYNKNTILSKFTPYTFIYEIPSGFSKEEMQLIYYDDNGKEFHINLKPSHLENTEVITAKLGEVLKFDKSLLKDTVLKVDSIEFSNIFRLTYQFCYQENCKDSYIDLTPSYTDNYRKVLMKVTNSFILGKNATMSDLNFVDLMSKFGKIEYELDGVEKVFNGPIREVTTKKVAQNNITYLEVPEEIQNASKIQFSIKIRNKIYKYIVK